MLSILSLDSPAARADGSSILSVPVSAATDEIVAEQSLEPEEYELVLGRMQVASVLFVGVVILVTFSALSYLAGKALASQATVVSAPVSLEAPPAAAPVAVQTAVPPATPIPVEVPEPPMFGNPTPGALFLQLGAVEKGVAVIMVEGLRKRGFQAFLAPGPAENIFRVLVGPIPENGFREVREKVDQFGLNTFVRKYQP
jgi:cell division septation protein DedD